MGSASRKNSPWPNGLLPGQKSIRLAKKGGGSPFPGAGFRRFSPVIPWPPRLFAEAKRRERRRLLPALFGFGACFLARATRKRVCATNEFGDDSLIRCSPSFPEAKLGFEWNFFCYSYSCERAIFQIWEKAPRIERWGFFPRLRVFGVPFDLKKFP